jgi:CDP-diacylglycerol--serine O-phosphatidyltransferase
MTKTQSEFGVQLDSLADVISFGAAPSLLVYKWALAPLGAVGLFISFSFAACGALRLARFNVLAARGDKGSSRFFVGLPIPLAAGAIVALVIAHYRQFGSTTDAATHAPIAVVVLLLAFLMVSTIRYRTFKDLHLSPKSLALFLFLSVAGVAVGIATRASFVLVVYMAAYIAMGIAESVIAKARPARDAARLPAAVRAELAEDEALEPDEEDVESDKQEQDEYI